MDSVLDDDICILMHEKLHCDKRRQLDPTFSASSCEPSVASHFALVTAYEDIKKRLKETERENYSLKKRLRQMEEKLCGNRDEQSNGESDTVNKAFGAFREISIERDNLKKKLSAMEKEKNECTRSLNEQLQSKEVELLQIKSELETHQVMKSLSKTITDWEIDKLNSELKIRTAEQEVKFLREECGRLQGELQKIKKPSADKCLSGTEYFQDSESSEDSMRQAFWELKKEMSNLHLVTEVQAEVLRKLKGRVAATKKAAYGPVQCEEDLEKTCSKLLITAAGVTYKKMPFGSTNEDEFCEGASAPPQLEGLKTTDEKSDHINSISERPIPVGGRDCCEHDSYKKSSLEENSWVMPSPPKPSDTLFWESKKTTSSNNLGSYSNQKYTFNS